MSYGLPIYPHGRARPNHAPPWLHAAVQLRQEGHTWWCIDTALCVGRGASSRTVRLFGPPGLWGGQVKNDCHRQPCFVHWPYPRYYPTLGWWSLGGSGPLPPGEAEKLIERQWAAVCAHTGYDPPTGVVDGRTWPPKKPPLRSFT